MCPGDRAGLGDTSRCSTTGMSWATRPCGRRGLQRTPAVCCCQPLQSLTHTSIGRHARTRRCEVFERTTRRYDKPEFGIPQHQVDGVPVRVHEEVVWQHPFCRLMHFKRDIDLPQRARTRSAPAAGRAHVGPLTRRCCAARSRRSCPTTTSTSPTGRTRATCPLRPARSISTTTSTMMRDMFRHFGGDVHVFAVCQPSVPVLAAVGADGGRRRSVRAAVADRWPAARSTRASARPWSTSSPRSAAPTGSAATSSPACRGQVRVTDGRSIRASCSSPGS